MTVLCDVQKILLSGIIENTHMKRVARTCSETTNTLSGSPIPSAFCFPAMEPMSSVSPALPAFKNRRHFYASKRRIQDSNLRNSGEKKQTREKVTKVRGIFYGKRGIYGGVSGESGAEAGEKGVERGIGIKLGIKRPLTG